MTEQIASCALQEKEILLTRLYQSVFPPLCKYICKKGGSLEEAKDIFHDALIIYYEKNAVAIAIADQKAYVFGIAKHLWNKKLREKQRYTELHLLSLPLPSQRQDVVSAKLLVFLKQTGSKCMELLQAFYFENQNAEKIAERFGFSGVRSATVQKFKCLEKVRNLVKSNAQQYEDFLE
jgi:DNA-directed RNA polymerase specialized sigma24 family protein